MRRLAIVAVCGWLLVSAQAEEAKDAGWPEVITYRGKRRSAEWAERVYVAFRAKVLKIDGVWIEATAPRRWASRIESRTACRVQGRLLRVMDERSILLQLYGQPNLIPRSMRKRYRPDGAPNRTSPPGPTVRIAGDRLPHNKTDIRLIIACIGSTVVDGKRLADCRRIESPSKPVTKAQFAEALASGLLLCRWQEAQIDRHTPRGKVGVCSAWERRVVK